MTRKEALRIIDDTMTIFMPVLPQSFTKEQIDRVNEAVEILRGMREVKPSDRDLALPTVTPIVYDTLRANPDVTAKALYDLCKGSLPADWTANKVQYLLLNEMADSVIKVETKGKPNTYRIA